MDLIKSISTNSINYEDNTKLLFYENYKYEKTQYNVEEIFFGKAILLQQIRILRVDSNPHPKIKSVQSITQTAPIHNFEIFCRNLKKYSDKFECILENSTVNESGGTNDCIFPILSDFVTNHIVIRGMYEKITICIYGAPYTGTEGHLLLETAKNDVPLEKLQYTLNDMYEAGPLDKINLTNDDIELLNNYTIDSLISPYIKCEVLGAIKRAYYINPPDVNMVEKTKTGYIYYENDLNYYSECLFNFYLTLSLNENKTNKSAKGNSLQTESKYLHTINSNNSAVSEEITLQSYFKKIFDILKILISKNYAFLEQDCIFRKENTEIFNKIPESLVDVVIYALNGNEYGYSEIKSGLKLLKILTNSSHLIGLFVDKGGMELLYNLILRERNDQDFDRDGASTNYTNYSSTFTNSSSLVLNTLALDVIYRMITHTKAFNKFIENTDKSKVPHRYFMIRDNMKDDYTESTTSAMKGGSEKDLTVSNFSSKSKKKEKASDREKDKERNKKKSKREKKSKRDRRTSRSSSRSRSEERDRSYSKASGASADSYKYRMNKKKTQAKNILLKNGYQIILSLLVGKKNNIIVNIVKKIVNKISLILHMREFKNIADTINKSSIEENTNENQKFYFDKITKLIEKIFDYFSKLEIPYKIIFLKEHSELSGDYPYKNFWIEYLKIGRKFFKKSENCNLKSTIDNLSNSSNQISEYKIITNEEAILLEENQFIESILAILTFEKFYETKNYTDFALTSKNFITYILLSKGGINFFSKNFDLTMILRDYIIKLTDDLLTEKNFSHLTEEENFFSASIRPETFLSTNKSLFEHPKYSEINKILMKTSSNLELSDDFIIKINFLQLRYLLEISFVLLSKFDDFIMFKMEESKLEDFIDKSLDIFLLFSQNINRSNLSKQAFISLFYNEHFIEEIISLLNNYLENEPQEFEAHLTLIFEILVCVFSDSNRNTDVILIEYGNTLYEILNKLKIRMENIYDNTEMDPVNKDFFSKFETLINFLLPAKIFTENKEIKHLMQYVNNCLFNNVQKYNLNEKPINEDNLKEENIREYVKGLKLNILHYENSDVDYLDTLKKKNSLINELFVAVKIINLSIRINPLLLIDCVSEHIHLALRYLIVNTVHSLKSLLSNETLEYQENVKSELELDKYTRIKEYSVLLTHIYDILTLLLRHLLSSHVDNYRDNMVIDNTVNLLIILINSLYNIYSHDEGTSANFNYSDINLYVVEDLQRLFGSVLNAFKEICKFNTTIKLNIEKIMEKISERPQNKGPMIYIFNFMFSIINNEYTIETFVEHFMKIQKPTTIDIFNELESNTKHHAIKIGHLCEDKSFIQYFIEIGINTNNDWIMNNCANLLISIQRAYKDKSKGNLYEQICDQILNAINSSFTRINKIDLSIIEDKEIPNFLISLDLIHRIIKFIFIFLNSEFKFLYIFHDISSVYLKILMYFKEYLGKTLLKPNYKTNFDTSDNMNRLANKVMDILNMLMDSFVVICDNKKGFENIIHEELNYDIHYDIVEEIPNKNEIVLILKEIKTFLIIDNLWEIENNSDVILFNKFLNLTLKSVNIIEKLSANFYGQIIILYQDYSSNNILKQSSLNPILVLNNLIKGIVHCLNRADKTCMSQNILIEILESITVTIIMLIFDLNHFELNEQTSHYDVIKLNRIYLPVMDKTNFNVVITENRIQGLIQFIIGDHNLTKEESVKSISEIFTQIYESIFNREDTNFTQEGNSNLESNSIHKMRKKIMNNLAQNISILANLFSSLTNFKVVNANEKNHASSDTLQLVKLPNARKIYEKLEIIYKFYEFYSTQNYSYDLPFSMSNAAILNPSSQLSNIAMTSRYNINDFEKLLNWKKYRIYLSKSDNLFTRTSLFDLDTTLKIRPEEFLLVSNLDLCLLIDSLGYKKKYTVTNSETFQQFCNQMLNESLLLNKFSNISYSITSSQVHKFSVFSAFDYYNQESVNLCYKNYFNLKYEVESIKNKTELKDIQSGLIKVKSLGLIAPLLRTKKKINSKFNTFIYKPKFEKMPKPILGTSAATSSSISIRDTNRYASVVSGRTLSVHMDKFNPAQTVVNPTYANSEDIVNTQIQELAEKDISADENKIEEVRKEETIEKILVEKTAVQQVTTEIVNPVTNPQLSFENRMITNNLHITSTVNTQQNKVEAIKSQHMNVNVVNPQLNLRMVTPMTNYNQGYQPLMNPNLNTNMQSGLSQPNQMQNPTPTQQMNYQFNPYQYNQPNMNPNLMIGQPNQMPINYQGMRPPSTPMSMNPQMNQIYNQNMMNMNKNMMNYNQIPGQPHYNYAQQMNQYNQQHQHQQINQMMGVSSYGQNLQNVTPQLNVDYNRMNQQQSITQMQTVQLEERKNVITPSTQNNPNPNAASNNTNILTNILQVLQNPDLKNMLGKINQPLSQTPVDDKSKDPRIRKKK